MTFRSAQTCGRPVIARPKTGRRRTGTSWGACVPRLRALVPGGLPRGGEVGVDWRVLAFALAVSLLAAVAVGLVPAIRAAGSDARQALASGHRSQGGGVASRPARGALVASQ